MLTNPEVPGNVPIPAIDTDTPVPDGSVTVHESCTVWLPPIVTELGLATNDVIDGAGHALATTCVVVDADAPHPAVAVNV
jgi:hypothetical protein